MKYFLSFLRSSTSGLALGIAPEAVASLRYLPGTAGGLVGEDEEERRFSLPHFFGFPGVELRHGIVLKGEGKTRVLLLGAVEKEVEYSPAEIYPPPALFSALGVYTFLSGLCFLRADSGLTLPLLLIDPVRLVEEIDRVHDQGAVWG
ncbi:MAG: hypothetical protein LBU21_02260 [Treponema sp.]|jgi:hypothetical protein|nr:hypothetical protein [Treponema sp.]